jgi:hypothetical protein
MPRIQRPKNAVKLALPKALPLMYEVHKRLGCVRWKLEPVHAQRVKREDMIQLLEPAKPPVNQLWLAWRDTRLEHPRVSFVRDQTSRISSHLHL